MVVRFGPEIIIDKDIILNRIKVNPNSPSYENILKTFDMQSNYAKKIIKLELESVYLIEENNNILNIEEVDKCKKIAYCFVSAGAKVVNTINNYFSEGKYLEGYLLSSISDEVVMNITRQMREFIRKQVKSDGYNITKRYSPGECGLDMKYQRTIIDEIKKKTTINAFLTDSYMIVPEKSTFFMYGIDKNIPETNIDHDCSQCTRNNCPYRK